MGDVELKKSSLWQEGMRGFAEGWRQWVPLAVIFFVIMAAFNAEMTHFMGPMQAKLQELKTQKDAHATWAFFVSNGPALGGFLVGLCLAASAEHYLFLSLFMRKALPAEMAAPTVRDFFCFLSKNIQLIFIIIVPAMSGVIVSLGLSKLSKPAFAAGIVVTVLIEIFLIVRFYLTIPLAAGKVTAPLKNSWEITQNHFWRLVGNALMLTIIYLGIYILIVLAALIAGLALTLVAKIMIFQVTDMMSLCVKVVVSTIFPVLVAGIGSAYASAVARILYQEKRQADSNFVLTTRS